MLSRRLAAFSRQVIFPRRLLGFSTDASTSTTIPNNSENPNHLTSDLSLEESEKNDPLEDTTEIAATLDSINADREIVASDEELDSLYRSLELEVRGHDKSVLQSYVTYLEKAAENLGLDCEAFPPPRRTTFWKWTVLKSRHVHKKHKVQYETRTNVRQVFLHRLTGSTADTYLEYVERNLPEGVALKATSNVVDHLPSHILSDILHNTQKTNDDEKVDSV